MPNDPTFDTKNQQAQGGAQWDIGGVANINSGGIFNVEAGGAFQVAGVDQTAAIAVAVAGVAAGYKIARGQATTVAALDDITTGLATVVAVLAVLDDDPVAGCQFVTAQKGGTAGRFNLKTWMATAAGNTALIAATTFGKKVNWIAVGT